MIKQPETVERFAPFTNKEFFDAVGRVIEIAETSEEVGLDYSPLKHVELMLTVAERMQMDTLLDKTKLISLLTGSLAWIARRNKKEIAFELHDRVTQLTVDLMAAERTGQSKAEAAEFVAESPAASELELRAARARELVNQVFQFVAEDDNLAELMRIQPLDQITAMADMAMEAGPGPALFGLAAWIAANHREATRQRLDELTAMVKALH